jgi:hypothetical protein
MIVTGVWWRACGNGGGGGGGVLVQELQSGVTSWGVLWCGQGGV